MCWLYKYYCFDHIAQSTIWQRTTINFLLNNNRHIIWNNYFSKIVIWKTWQLWTLKTDRFPKWFANIYKPSPPCILYGSERVNYKMMCCCFYSYTDNWSRMPGRNLLTMWSPLNRVRPKKGEYEILFHKQVCHFIHRSSFVRV